MKRWYTDEVLDADEYIKRLQIENLELANKELKTRNKLKWVIITGIIAIVVITISTLILYKLGLNKP